MLNNGHTIQFDFEPGDYIIINGDQYELKQFHKPAEHTTKGVRYSLVILMVHNNKE